MDPLLLMMVGLLAVMIFFTWRNGKKRKTEAEQMQSKLQPGVEVMTQHGIFGTLLTIDEEANFALIESTPGTVLRVHRQTIARVVEDETLAAEAAELDEVAENEVGERTDDTDTPGDKRSGD